MDKELISSLISEPMMLHNSKRIIGAQVVSILSKNKEVVSKTYQDFKNEIKAYQFSSGPNDTDQKYVAVIPITGIVRKYGYGSTSHISQLLDELKSDPNVAGVVFYHDTPGGSASGTGILAQKIFDFNKPTAAYIHGLCCSAGEYLAAPTNRRFVNKGADWMGSIGTMMSVLDFIPLFEKFGAKYFEIYADGSEDKNASWRNLTRADESDEKLIKEEINSYRDEFVEDMKSFQPGLTDEVFTGKIYRPKDAVKIGLADQLGTLQDACQWVYNQSNQSKDKNPSNMSNMKFAALTALLGVSSIEAKGGLLFGAKTASFTEEQLETIENALANQPKDESAEVKKLQDKVTELENSEKATSGELKSMNNIIDAAMKKANVESKTEATSEDNLKNLISALGARSAAKPTNINSPEETNTEAPAAYDYFEGVDVENL